MQARVRNDNANMAMRNGTDNFHLANRCDNTDNLSSTDLYTYILIDDAIFTSFTTGEVEIAYKGISTDENGGYNSR